MLKTTKKYFPCNVPNERTPPPKPFTKSFIFPKPGACNIKLHQNDSQGHASDSTKTSEPSSSDKLKFLVKLGKFKLSSKRAVAQDTFSSQLNKM